MTTETVTPSVYTWATNRAKWARNPVPRGE